jgi:hypothetical protein
MKKFFVSIIWCFPLTQIILAQATPPRLSDAEAHEVLTLVTNINHASLAYQAVAVQQMLQEANYYSERLKLPTPHPIQISDLQEIRVSDPWYSVMRENTAPHYPATVFTTNIFNSSILREQRLRALKISANGVLATTNFFSFEKGVLWNVLRINEEGVEYHPPLKKKVIIGKREAYQLATQYLAAVSVDVTELEEKLTSRVWQDYYGPGTNAILAHFFRVGWGEGDPPPVEVAIDGTTKKLLSIQMPDTSLSRRPLLLITNALDLIRAPNPSVKQLQNPATARAYALTPMQVSNYAVSHSQLTNSSSP